MPVACSSGRVVVGVGGEDDEYDEEIDEAEMPYEGSESDEDEDLWLPVAYSSGRVVVRSSCRNSSRIVAGSSRKQW